MLTKFAVNIKMYKKYDNLIRICLMIIFNGQMAFVLLFLWITDTVGLPKT